MLNASLLLFAVLFVIGILTGGFYFKKYTDIVNSISPIPFFKIVTTSVLIASSCFFIFIGLITIGISLSEDKQVWLIQELVALLVISGIVGFVVFLGSVYQIYTTIKYRDMLIRKKVIKGK